MLKRERKALVACRKGHNRALGQSESQLLLPARHLSSHGGNLSYLITWVPLSAVHLLYEPPLWNHQRDHIHLYSLEQNRADSGLSVQGRLKPQLQTRQPQAERSLQEQPPAHPSHTLPKAPAHGCAVARLHSWSKPGFDTSSSHWKCQMRSRWLGWKQEQQPKLSGEQLIFGTHESKQKCLLIPSNKPDSTSTYSSSSSSFTKGCFSATNCSLWEMPCFNLQPEGCLTIVQRSLC